MTVFNIRTVRLQSGDQFRDVKEVDLEPLELEDVGDLLAQVVVVFDE